MQHEAGKLHVEPSPLSASPTTSGETSKAELLSHVRLLADAENRHAYYLKKRAWHLYLRYGLIGFVTACSCFALFSMALSVWVLPLMHPMETVVEPTDTVWKLRRTAGYQALRQEERKRLLHYVRGNNREISIPARSALENWMNTRGREFSRPDIFREFLRKQPGAPIYVASTTTFNVRRPAPFSLSKTNTFRRFPFHSKRAAATAYDVRIGQKRIQLVQTDVHSLPGMQYHTAQEVVRALALIPTSSLDRIWEVHIEPVACPSDADRRKRQRQQSLKADPTYMSASGGVIRIYPTDYKMTPDYIVNSLLHEIGHLLSQQELGWNEEGPTWNTWKSAIQQDGFVASPYGRLVYLEDFAETYLLYHMTQGRPQQARELRRLFPARFGIIDRLLARQTAKANTQPIK